MNSFLYFNPVKLYFGKEQLKNLPLEIETYGLNVLLTYGGGSIKENDIYDEVTSVLTGCNIVDFSGIQPNPDVESVRDAVKLCKNRNIDVIVAVGGGSVIDASKWMAVSAKVDFDPWDFFCKKTSIDDALPIIAIPTTASTGSEMNSGGVLSNRKLGKKVGRSSPYMFPKFSFLVPEFTFTVGEYQTACGLVDIVSHILEVYFTQQETLGVLKGIMESLVRTVINNGKVVLRVPDDYESRANLLYAASWAINGFINGPVRQSWNCHTIEHELSARYDMAHGQGMAVLLPRWLKYCLNGKNKDVYNCCAKNMFGCDSIDELFDTMERVFFEEFNLKSSLNNLGVSKDDIDDIADTLCSDGPIKGFADLRRDDVKGILEMCF